MSTTSMFIVAGLGGYALGLSACTATEISSTEAATAKPSLHRLAKPKAGTGQPPKAHTWRQGLPPRPKRLALPALPGYRHVPQSYDVQLPDLASSISPERAALWQVPVRIELAPLRRQRSPTSQSVEGSSLARR